jgi:ABC-2 type transport system ATP-binding protein
MDDVVISVKNVYKDFYLPQDRASSIKSLFTRGLRFGRRNYEMQHALKDVSFQVKRGEFFGIVGRNGSGKSTLLKMLAGLYQPNEGSVEVRGRLVPFIELGVGFNGELTGRENVYLNGALLGFSKKKIDAMYDDIVKFAELEAFMDQKLKNYSSGMQVRLAFSVATRAETDILLVDEVLAVGDADFQRKCFEYFRHLKKNKKTVVFVSHDMNAVREYCDRAIMIEKSELVASGDTETVATKYTRLFADTDSGSSATDNDERWGDGTIEYSKVVVTPKKIGENDTITIKCTAKIIKEIDSPIFGFSIRTAVGEVIVGTNSRIKHQQPGTLKAGAEVDIEWTMPNIFTDGTYTVNVAATHDNGVTECDHWDDAAKFKIYKDERSPYIVTPAIELDLTYR